MSVVEIKVGGSCALPAQPIGIVVPGPYRTYALVVGPAGEVDADADFVQPGQHTYGVAHGGNLIVVSPPYLRPGPCRVILIATPDRPGIPFSSAETPMVALVDLEGMAFAQFTLRNLRRKTAVRLGEIALTEGWRFHPDGTGYSDGLLGIGAEFGVDALAPAVPESSSVRARNRPGTLPTTKPKVPAPATPIHDASVRAGLAGRRDAIQPVAEPTPTADFPADYHCREVIALTNSARSRIGLRALVPRSALEQAARAHSADMLARDYFAHESPEGDEIGDRARAVGYEFELVTENIAVGQATAADVVRSWLDSPGHRANIMNPDVTEIGIAAVGAGCRGPYWTQVFGQPR